MNKLNIRMETDEIDSLLLQRINQTLTALARTIEIELRETGIFEDTSLQSVEIIQSISQTHLIENSIEYNDEKTICILKSKLARERVECEKVSDSYQYCKSEALSALIDLLDTNNLNTRPFIVRKFHIEGQVSRGIIIQDKDTKQDAISGLEIHFKISESNPSAEEFDSFAVQLADKIDSILEENELGYIDGNEVGGGFIILFCSSENPFKSYKALKTLLEEYSKSEEDFVVLSTPPTERRVSLNNEHS